MSRPARVSPDRILTAAAAEFAAHGYGGARVDRIARRARVNKAMLYYHFGSKQTLYRALLRQVFAAAAARLTAIAARDLTPAEKIESVIAEMARFVDEHGFFPAIMLREIAEGGAHLDEETFAVLASVPVTVVHIIEQGRAQHVIRPVHPLAAYLTIIGPIVLFLAAAPIRKQLASRHLQLMSTLTPDRLVHELQQSMRLALVLPPTSPPAP